MPTPILEHHLGQDMTELGGKVLETIQYMFLLQILVEVVLFQAKQHL